MMDGNHVAVYDGVAYLCVSEANRKQLRANPRRIDPPTFRVISRLVGAFSPRFRVWSISWMRVASASSRDRPDRS